MDSLYIYGIRAIIEAVESQRNIDKVYLQKSASGGLMQQLQALIKNHNIARRFGH